MDNDFRDIIIYILNQNWAHRNNNIYHQKWNNIRYLFGLKVEKTRYSGLSFVKDEFAPILDFNLLLESKDKKVNMTFSKHGVNINYLRLRSGNWRYGKMKILYFDELEGQDNIKKAEEIINWIQTCLTAVPERDLRMPGVYNKSAENSTSNYSFGSLQYF